MKVTIIKYNAGNVQSVLFALKRLGIDAELSDNIETIRNSEKVIFPGVGEASSAMKYLKQNKLDLVIPELKQPVLGICLGMQLMCSFSEENNTACLGIFNARVKMFNPVKKEKVPQIGWNTIRNLKTKLFYKVPENDYVYFVHGFYAEQNEYEIATANYILDYAAALNKNNFYAVQFHPEKSGDTGAQILKNFIEL